MTVSVLLLSAFAVALLLLLAWAIRSPGSSSHTSDLDVSDELGRNHVTFFPQMRQATAQEDFAFLASHGSRRLLQTVRKERRSIALNYLRCLKEDFSKLWQLSRVLARLSPQVVAGQEFERFRLGVSFAIRYEMVRFGLAFGFSPFADLNSLSEMVGKLAIRLETAMNELGERAALAGELASTLHRRGLDGS